MPRREVTDHYHVGTKAADIVEKRTSKQPRRKTLLVPASFLREYTWFCEECENLEIETKTFYEPTEKAMIINRLMRIQEDYDILETTVSSLPNEIVFRARLPDFDMGER